MKINRFCLACAYALLAAAAAIAAEPGVQAEVHLTGADLRAWREPVGEWKTVGEVRLDLADATKFAVADTSGEVLVNGPGRTSNLVSKLEHGDCALHVEFMVPQGSNSGVYLQGRYEVQILDSWGVAQPKYGDCGGIYQSDQGFEGRAPRVNASHKPGEWQMFDIVFQAPRFDTAGKKASSAKFVRVVLNGVVIHENVEVPGPTRSAAFADEKPVGPLMLQGDHGPVAYRNIRVSAAANR